MKSGMFSVGGSHLKALFTPPESVCELVWRSWGANAGNVAEPIVVLKRILQKGLPKVSDIASLYCCRYRIKQNINMRSGSLCPTLHRGSAAGDTGSLSRINCVSFFTCKEPRLSTRKGCVRSVLCRVVLSCAVFPCRVVSYYLVLRCFVL